MPEPMPDMAPLAAGTRPTVAETSTRNRSSALRRSLTRVGPALALVIVVAAFALMTGEPSHYLSPLNLRIVLSQTVIVALGAIGMTMIIVSGGIDLSAGSWGRVRVVWR